MLEANNEYEAPTYLSPYLPLKIQLAHHKKTYKQLSFPSVLRLPLADSSVALFPRAHERTHII